MPYRLLISALLFASPVVAQHWQVTGYGAGWKVAETESRGNNPYTIYKQLRDPLPYLYMVNAIPANSLTGNPGITVLHQFYLHGELQRINSDSRFWKKHSIPFGIVGTGKMESQRGNISQITYLTSTDTTRYEERFTPYRTIQFIGLHTGLLRYFNIGRHFAFVTGIQLQGALAIQHDYRVVYDTLSFSTINGWNQKSTPGATLAGDNHLQWQAMVPVSFEYRFLQNRFALRLEAFLGILYDPYTPGTFADMSTDGLGATLLYRPKKQIPNAKPARR